MFLYMIIYDFYYKSFYMFLCIWFLLQIFFLFSKTEKSVLLYLGVTWLFRRGDPDKTDYFGNTCLHLAAARGHEFCVKFLVKFGCNIWSLDIDRHSARELAAINGCEKILHFLDIAQADQELNNRKKSRLLREKAERDAEKRYSRGMWIVFAPTWKERVKETDIVAICGSFD